jgi:predicted transcriptional regulator
MAKINYKETIKTILQSGNLQSKEKLIMIIVYINSTDTTKKVFINASNVAYEAGMCESNAKTILKSLYEKRYLNRDIIIRDKNLTTHCYSLTSKIFDDFEEFQSQVKKLLG